MGEICSSIVGKELAIVTWQDCTSYGEGHWISRREMDYELCRDFPECVSVGLVWESTDDHIVLIQSLFADGQTFGSVLRIPQDMVMGFERLGTIGEKAFFDCRCEVREDECCDVDTDGST